jgi:hypothetical protein
MIGKQISPILVEIEETLWEFEAEAKMKPEYSLEGFRATVKIFMSAILDKMWEIQNWDNMQFENREIMAEKAGQELRKFIKTFTGVDTHQLYEKRHE